MKYVKHSIYLLIAIIYLSLNVVAAEESELTENTEVIEDNELTKDTDAVLDKEIKEDTIENDKKPVVYTEAGFIYSSEDSFKSGEYTGLEEEGFLANVNFSILSPSVYDDDEKKIFYELTGTNLGLDSRSVFGKYGELGKYSVYIDYDQLPRFQFDDAFSVFSGAGTTNQTLPAGWVPTGNNPATLAATNATFPSSNQIDVETERKKFGGGFSWNVSELWQVTGNYHHERKDGTETLGAETGGGGGGPSSILIVPVDYQNDEFDVGISYVDRKKQFELRYYLSLFRNDDASVTWENPFTQGFTTGRIGLDPDNQAHQISSSGGYYLGQTGRVSGSLSWTRMIQDDTFLPYTTNAALLTVNPNLPRTDLDGEVDKWYANLNYTVRPMKNLDMAVRYTFNKYDNNTPTAVYNRVVNDRTAQNAASTVQNSVNRPYNFEQHKAELNAGYRLTRKIKLDVGYEYDWNQRDNAEAEITREHTGKVKLSSNLSNMTRGWLEYAYSDRTHSYYDPTRPFRAGVDPALLPAGCSIPPFTGCILNDILTRKYYLAERQQNKVTGSLTMMPTNLVSLGITGNAIDEDFDETVVGLQKRTRYNATIDLSYTPRENIDTFAYYTHEFFDTEQAGRITGVTNDWLYDTEDRVNTVGAGFKWSNIKGKFDLTADYTFSKAITEVDPTDIPIDTAIDFPDLKTTIHSLNLRGDYHLKDDVTMRMNYRYEYFSNDDWALDGIGQADISRVIWTGQGSPDYTDHFVGFSVVHKFK